LLALVLAFGLVVAGCDNDPGGDAKVNLAVPGLKPVVGEAPKATVDTDQYTGAVTWAGDLDDGKFTTDVAYTATITLTKKTGYTFEGVAANSLGVTGAETITHEAGVGDSETLAITAVFAALTGDGGSDPVAIELFDEDEAAGSAKWPIDQKLPFKYFIISSVGGGEGGSDGNTPTFNGGGFGGLQPALQGQGVTQEIRATGNWNNLTHTATEPVYFVFDLSGYDCYSELSASGWKQFYINYGKGVLGTYQGYVVPNSVTSLTKPDGAVEYDGTNSDGYKKAPGYITKTLPIEIKLPE